jgi:hypothetical protein
MAVRGQAARPLDGDRVVSGHEGSGVPLVCGKLREVIERQVAAGPEGGLVLEPVVVISGLSVKQDLTGERAGAPAAPPAPPSPSRRGRGRGRGGPGGGAG